MTSTARFLVGVLVVVALVLGLGQVHASATQATATGSPDRHSHVVRVSEDGDDLIEPSKATRQ
jgi:hypothetical protein